MAAASERVLRMKQDFMDLHTQGYSIPEIAKICNLAFGTVYRHLQEIADENGVLREELLKIVRVQKSERNFSGTSEHVNIDIAELETGFEEAVCAVDKVISRVESIIKTAKGEIGNAC